MSYCFLQGEDNVLRTKQQAAVTLQLLKKLDIKPHPMFRPQGVSVKPLTLFQKMGVGQLDLYILSPGKTSQEYETFMQNWPDRTTSLSKSESLPLTTLASVSVLLVWHPACPQEKVVRVLFPGVTPQAKLLQGLEKLKALDFLQKPTVTTGDLERLGEDRKVKRTDSMDSGKSQRKEGSPKYVKERGVKEEGKEKGKTLIGVGGRDMDKAKVKETSLKHKASFSEKSSSKKGVGKFGKKEEKTGDKEENSIKKNEQMKRNSVSSKAKSENKTKPKKDAKNDSKMGEKKSQKIPGNEANHSKKVYGNTELPNNKSTKQKTVESETLRKEKENQKREPENHHGSKMSTPEDMTEDFLRLRQERKQEEGQVETADKEKQKSSELGNIKRLEDLSEESCNKTADRSEEAAGGSGLKEVESTVSLMRHIPGAGKKAETDSKKNLPDEPVKSNRPVKVVGFPSPLNKASMTECTVQLDVTPTEYTLLDGALRNTPPSQASPENQAPNSPDEETAEPVSPDSRPNSAGHTPYCLSPDDVWCNRTALSRLQAQGNPDSADPYDPDGSSRQSDEPKGVSEICSNSKEKHLSFLSLGAFKDGSSEPSPSVTTTTTHSLPAEVSSPQSTEVDESLSMSFEQGPTTVSQREGDASVYQSHSNGGYFVGMPLSVKKPPRSLGQSSDMGRPFAPNTLHFEASAHDVDLCLVSPCEFKHFKQPDSSSGTSDSSKGAFASNHHGNNNNNPKDRSPSESNAPACTEDCPSTTADGVLDSDSDESCSDPSNSPCDLNSSQALPPDPLPAPLRDSPPLPPHPDTSMPVPQSDSEAHGKRAKASGSRVKNMSAVSTFVYQYCLISFSTL